MKFRKLKGKIHGREDKNYVRESFGGKNGTIDMGQPKKIRIKAEKPLNNLNFSRKELDKTLPAKLATEAEIKVQLPTTSHYIPTGPAKSPQQINYGQFKALLEDSEHSFGKGLLLEVLGLGAGASVRLLESGSNKYAVKVYEKYKLLEPRKKKRVYREVELLGRMEPHQNVIRMYQAYEDKRQVPLKNYLRFI